MPLNEILNSVGLIAALFAAFYAWRSAQLVGVERREQALNAVVEAVEGVRTSAEASVASYDVKRTREDRLGATNDFRRAQARLRLGLANGHLPRGFSADQDVREHLAALLDDRALGAARAAPPVLDAARKVQFRPVASSRPVWLRRRRDERHLLDLENEPRPSSGYAVCTRRGATRRVEMVVPAPRGGLLHRWRDADDLESAWTTSRPFATQLHPISAVTICQGNFNDPGWLEIVVRVDGRLVHLSRAPSFAESVDADHSDLAIEITRLDMVDDACGVPAIIQSLFGNKGNFEVVTPLLGGGLAHLWRDNDDPRYPWKLAKRFGYDLAERFDAVALIHSDLQDEHLEVIARADVRLLHFWRSNSSPSQWRPARMVNASGTEISERVAGLPAFIQSRRRGSRGNFEVVAPLADGGFLHVWRDNDDQADVWRPAVLDDVLAVGAAAVFEGALRTDGSRDLQMLLHAGDRTVHRHQPQPHRRTRGARPPMRPGMRPMADGAQRAAAVGEVPLTLPMTEDVAGGADESRHRAG